MTSFVNPNADPHQASEQVFSDNEVPLGGSSNELEGKKIGSTLFF